MVAYFEKYQLFKIDTLNTTYAFKVVHDKYVSHIYYGKKINDETALNEMYNEVPVSFAAYPKDVGVDFSLETVLTELSFFDSGDIKDIAIKIEHNGSSITEFEYKDYKIYNGRVVFDDMPYSRNGDKTLEIIYYDKLSKIELHSYYIVYYDTDTIVRFVKFVNLGCEKVVLRKAMSMQLDLPTSDYNFGYLVGEYYNERNYVENHINIGKQSIYSKRGHSSHHFNPFAMLKSVGATETSGDVYGVEFVYSGDFVISVEKTFSQKARLTVGLNDETFSWLLFPNGEFFTPEVIMTYSSNGVGQMSRNFHSHLRNNVINPNFVYKKRPMVVNSWEATFFDIDENILIEYAESAKEIGVDTLVIDDGWFGLRNDDTSSLGDWYVNKNKFPNLKEFSEKIHALGLNLGIWIEPEMISPNSDLFRAHPGWALGQPSREYLISRKQLVLDLCNDDAVNHVANQIIETLKDVQLEYIKWDFNRSLSNAYSLALPQERQGEVKHRFQLGSYKLHKILTEAFPNVLFEGCSGGGGRFDAGMLFYCPQIWTSDNTDPIDRLRIQYGTNLAYPLSSISAHVSNAKNNEVEQNLNVGLRFAVASCGVLGYELDVRKLTDETKRKLLSLNTMYADLSELILKGDLYRDNNVVCIRSNDKKFAYIVCFNVDGNKQCDLSRLGLNKNISYIDKLSGKSLKDISLDFNGELYKIFLLKGE